MITKQNNVSGLFTPPFLRTIFQIFTGKIDQEMVQYQQSRRHIDSLPVGCLFVNLDWHTFPKSRINTWKPLLLPPSPNSPTFSRQFFLSDYSSVLLPCIASQFLTWFVLYMVNKTEKISFVRIYCKIHSLISYSSSWRRLSRQV